MPIREIIPARSHEGGSLDVQHGPMDLTVGFEAGSLVFMNAAGSVEGFPIDGTQAILADTGTTANMVGVAAYGPGRAATAEFVGNSVKINPDTGNAFVAGDLVAYYPADHNNLFKAQVLATGGAAAGTGLATHRGELFQVTYSAGTTPDLGWGVELTAGVVGTDVLARVVEVLAADGRVTGTAGTHFLFELMTAL
jgi:hypothetical protein